MRSYVAELNASVAAQRAQDDTVKQAQAEAARRLRLTVVSSTC
jgi:hypothetical protein